MAVRNENAVSSAILSVFSLIGFVILLAWSPGTKRMPDAREFQELKDDLAFLRKEGRWREAELPASKLRDLAPSNHMYLQALAEIYHHTNRTADEVRMWEQFVQFAPLPAEACPDWPRAYENLGQPASALRTYQRCL